MLACLGLSCQYANKFSLCFIIFYFAVHSKRTLTPTKKVTKEDFEKSRKDVEEIYVLFRDFVAQNRPQLDIDSVATGETWFGTAALEKNLCDEINTVDDVLTQYVANGYDVYQVDYKPPIEESVFGRFLQPSSSSSSSSSTSTSSSSSIIDQPIRWLVRTIASTIQDELSLSSLNQVPIDQRYKVQDDTADRIRIQSDE
jgi:ClpP class serine protease